MVKKRVLSREKVLDTASDIIDSDGISGLSIHNLAAALDVRPQSIYNYAKGLDDLVDQVGIAFVDEVSQRITQKLVGVSGKEALRVFAKEFRAVSLQHSGLAPLILNPNILPKNSNTHQALIELYRNLFNPLHLNDENLKIESTLYRSALFGFILQETGDFFLLPSDELDDRFTKTMDLAIGQIEL